jgi:hypothetical protein
MLWSDKLTVEALIEALEDCDPHARVRLAHQPSWPLQFVVDPDHPTAALDLERTDGLPPGGRAAGLPARTRPRPARLVAVGGRTGDQARCG